MNILFVLYGGFDTNSAIPLCNHARELQSRGHRCTVAIPCTSDKPPPALHAPRTVSYEQALKDPSAIFEDGRTADVLHAWTPREVVRTFITEYQAKRPTPWILYHEDNEDWIAKAALGMTGFPVDALLQHTDEVISAWTPPGMPHPLNFRAFIGLADAAVVIQDKLAVDVPPWVPCSTVMPGVDLELFSPRPADPALRAHYGVKDAERVIVYPGGLNDFTRPGLEALCRAVGIVNARGMPCRLLRTGPVPLDFLHRLPPQAAANVTDLGPVPHRDIPAVLALADALVQPGEPTPFEDLRLPGKLPELLASGRPVVLPDANIAHLLRDGVDAVLHRTGTPEEIAEKCLALFADPARARAIGEAGRRFAQTRFDPPTQAGLLETVYENACKAFDASAARDVWIGATAATPVDALLARKLHTLGRGAGADAPVLEAYAARLEEACDRGQGLETAIALRDRDLKSLRQQLDELQQRYNEMGAHAHDVSIALRDVEARAGTLAVKLAEGDARIADLATQVAARDAHIAAVHASLSWRLMAPFRAISRLFKPS